MHHLYCNSLKRSVPPSATFESTCSHAIRPSFSIAHHHWSHIQHGSNHADPVKGIVSRHVQHPKSIQIQKFLLGSLTFETILVGFPKFLKIFDSTQKSSNKP